MPQIEVDLSRTPADPDAAQGYQELYRLWATHADKLEKGHDVESSEFRDWVQKIETHLTLREALFFNEPFEPEVVKVPDLVHAKTIGRVYKILMDRHGFKVAKDKGGLGR